MRLLCRWRQHRLAQEIVAGKTVPSQSALCLHLAQCAECRLAYDHLQRLHGELVQSVLPPALSEGFTNSIQAEILVRAQARQHPSMPKAVFVFGGAAATTLVCVFALRFATQQTKLKVLSAPSVTASTPKEKLNANSPAVPPRTSAKRTITLIRPEADKKRILHKRSHPHSARRLIAYTPNHPARYHEVTWKPKLQPPMTPIITPEIRSHQWAQWANYYETHGDYTHAADAYARAYDTLPTEGTAFAAGQAAENAGDVSQAILYYSQILRQPLKQKSQTEKGTFRWNSERDAA